MTAPIGGEFVLDGIVNHSQCGVRYQTGEHRIKQEQDTEMIESG